jgi:hypothetical protein
VGADFPGAESCGWVTLILADEVPSGENALDHVVDAGLLDLVAADCRLELGAPVLVLVGEVGAWHGHVEAAVCAAGCGVLSCDIVSSGMNHMVREMYRSNRT